LSKAPSLSLTKLIEATKIQPRTGLSLGLPPVSVPYGALVEPVSSERDRQRFTYLGDLYECTCDLFLSATGGSRSESPASAESAPEPAHAPVVEKAPEPAAPSGPRLEWDPVNSSEYSVRRAAVPGGWLVTVNAAVIFVPDIKHRWDGGTVA
jgi:hypothetical protein